MKRKLVALGLILSLVALPVAACAQPAPAPAPAPAPSPAPAPVPEIQLLYGSGAPTTSSAYPAHAKMNEIVDSVEGISSSLVGVGGSEAAVAMMFLGQLDLAGWSGYSVIYDSVNGEGRWERNAQPNTTRVLCAAIVQEGAFTVRRDSGINNVEQLDGKRFLTGMPGSTDESTRAKSLEALGIIVEPFIGSLGDAVVAFKDGRIDGFGKASPRGRLDASHVDAQTSVPIKMIGLTEEQTMKVQEKYPYIAFRHVPTGFWPDLPEDGDTWVIYNVLFQFASSRMSEEVAYKLVKQIHARWADLEAVYPAFKDIAMLESPEMASLVEDVYLHAGAIKYYRENGSNIPDSVVPPEMK